MNAQPATKIQEERPYFSHSSISTFRRCPRQYFYKYALCLPEEHRSSALAFGSSTHAWLAKYFRQRKDRGSVPEAQELKDCFVDSWNFELDNPVPVLFSEKETADSLKDTGVKLVDVFLQNQPKDIGKIIAIEEKFLADITDPGTGEVIEEEFLGYWDLVTEKDKVFTIWEHKTGARRYSTSQLENMLQLSGYGYAGHSLGLGQPSLKVNLLIKTKTPQYQHLSTTRNEADYRDFIQTVIGVLASIKAGADYPVRDWWCQGCSYAAKCTAG